MIRVPAKTTIGEVNPCNLVSPIWNLSEHSPTEKAEDTWGPELETLFEKLGLNEKKK